MEKEIISVENLYKKYTDKGDYAVKDISFSGYGGELVGIIGHNGAGKTTTLKCILGMLPFSDGSIKILGHDIKTSPVKAKRGFGFVTDNHSVFLKMTGMQYICFMADIYGVSNNERLRKIAELEQCFQLGKSIHNLIATYSHGMKQKICMMGSLMHSPQLWILDEPLIGLDPRTCQAVTQYMVDYAKKGNCVLFSSHNLDTVSRICSRVLMIKNGRLTDNITVADFKALHPDKNLEQYFLDDDRLHDVDAAISAIDAKDNDSNKSSNKKSKPDKPENDTESHVGQNTIVSDAVNTKNSVTSKDGNNKTAKKSKSGNDGNDNSSKDIFAVNKTALNTKNSTSSENSNKKSKHGKDKSDNDGNQDNLQEVAATIDKKG